MVHTPSLLLQFLKFSFVGTTGLAVDFGITWFCKERLKWNKFLASSCGFSLAVINNYLLNRMWTFNNIHTAFASSFTKFVLVSLVGLGLNNLLLYLLHSLSKWPFYASKGLATAVVLVWNFSANYFFTFHT